MVESVWGENLRKFLDGGGQNIRNLVKRQDKKEINEYIYIYIYIYTWKMVLDTSLLNTQQYKVVSRVSGAIQGKE